ncbi:MAG: HAD family hydrolase [Treponema sp.]|jgi:putative hydrolase of the HAD superfamily|nr:HAD family hydrolase [Treponema sp.]
MDHTLGAVAFDLDGTLYPNYRLNFRLIPFALRELPLLLAFGKARNRLRGKGCPREFFLPGEDYYDAQARLTAAQLGADTVKTKEKLDRLIYRSWESHFTRIKLFPHVRETLEKLRRGGLKLALLSDFTPEGKLKALGLEDLWDLVLCSERIGALKPDPLPFESLARGLGLEASRILYVGNSLSYDVRGAMNAGLKTALIRPWGGRSAADFVFFDYRKLAQYVLG